MTEWLLLLLLVRVESVPLLLLESNLSVALLLLATLPDRQVGPQHIGLRRSEAH